jgi:hypothetical protein
MPSFHESDGVLGAGDDAQPARAALIRGGRVRALPAVRHALQPSEERQACEVRIVDAPHFEDRMGADIDAVALAFAPRAVDDGPVSTRLRPALFAWSIGMTSGAPCFVAIYGRFGHFASCSPFIPLDRQVSVAPP